MSLASSPEMEKHYKKVARDVMEDLRLVLDEPELSDAPSELTAFPWLDASWYLKKTRELEALGFSVLRDIDGSPLRSRYTHASMIRVMVSADQRTSAGVYWIKAKASLPLYLLMKLLGKWPAPAAVVEFISYSNGGGTVTLNQASSFDAPPGYDRRVVEATTPLNEQLRTHTSRLPAEVDILSSFDRLFALRRGQLERQRMWRRQITIQKAELDRLLRPHGKNAEMIRPFLEQELRDWQTSFKPA